MELTRREILIGAYSTYVCGILYVCEEDGE